MIDLIVFLAFQFVLLFIFPPMLKGISLYSFWMILVLFFSDADTTTGVWGIQNNRVGLISSHDNINIPTTCFTYLEKQTNKQWNKWWIISLLILTTTRQVHYLIFMGWMFLNFYCVCMYVLFSFFLFYLQLQFCKEGSGAHCTHIYTQTYIYFACIWFIKQ